MRDPLDDPRSRIMVQSMYGLVAPVASPGMAAEDWSVRALSFGAIAEDYDRFRFRTAGAVVEWCCPDDRDRALQGCRLRAGQSAAATTSSVCSSSQSFPAAAPPNNIQGSDRSSVDCCAGATKARHRENSRIDSVAARHTSNASSRLPTTSCSTPQGTRVSDLVPPAVLR